MDRGRTAALRSATIARWAAQAALAAGLLINIESVSARPQFRTLNRFTGDGEFRQSLPDMPAGRYALYGDIVHASGLGETVTTKLDLPAIHGAPLTGDAAASGPLPVQSNYNPVVSELTGGYRMIWERGEGAIHARRPYQFRFRLTDEHGGTPADMELYMGMLGHAAFVATDGTVFAHVHPSGSVPMAALGLAEGGGAQSADPHAQHRHMSGGLPAEVSFP